MKSALAGIQSPFRRRVRALARSNHRLLGGVWLLSDVVLRELGDCKDDGKRRGLFGHLEEIQYNLIAVDESTVALAERIVTNGVLKRKNIDDCQHIAAAILSDCDIIVSWNFKHIVNVKTIRGIKVITTVEGYKDLLIYQPTALLDEEE